MDRRWAWLLVAGLLVPGGWMNQTSPDRGTRKSLKWDAITIAGVQQVQVAFRTPDGGMVMAVQSKDQQIQIWRFTRKATVPWILTLPEGWMVQDVVLTRSGLWWLLYREGQAPYLLQTDFSGNVRGQLQILTGGAHTGNLLRIHRIAWLGSGEQVVLVGSLQQETGRVPCGMLVDLQQKKVLWAKLYRFPQAGDLLHVVLQGPESAPGVITKITKLLFSGWIRNTISKQAVLFLQVDRSGGEVQWAQATGFQVSAQARMTVEEGGALSSETAFVSGRILDFSASARNERVVQPYLLTVSPEGDLQAFYIFPPPFLGISAFRSNPGSVGFLVGGDSEKDGLLVPCFGWIPRLTADTLQVRILCSSQFSGQTSGISCLVRDSSCVLAFQDEGKGELHLWRFVFEDSLWRIGQVPSSFPCMFETWFPPNRWNTRILTSENEKVHSVLLLAREENLSVTLRSASIPVQKQSGQQVRRVCP